MRRFILSLIPLLGLLLAGCPLPPENGGFSTVPDPGEQPCLPGGSSIHLLSQGLLAGASWMTCQQREPSGDGARFVGHVGQTTLVAGGSTELELSYEGLSELDGAVVLARVDTEPSMALVSLTSSEADQPGKVTVEVFTRPTAPGGSFSLKLGFDDGTGTADNPQPVEWYEIPFDVVATLGGDLQFALNWDTQTDVDLHVIGPAGEMIYYGNPVGTAGGTLDLDSNAACAIDDIQNENIIWETDTAPSGDYQIGVNYWSACGNAGVTNWRLTILERGEPVGTYRGMFSPEDEDPSADPLNVVTTYNFGG